MNGRVEREGGRKEDWQCVVLRDEEGEGRCKGKDVKGVGEQVGGGGGAKGKKAGREGGCLSGVG